MNQNLSPKEVAELIRTAGKLQLVDVRQPEEHREARIPGSRLMPLGTLDLRLQELDKKNPLLFYCAAGGRSGRALEYARQMGYENSAHLQGGIGAWMMQGLPVEP